MKKEKTETQKPEVKEQKSKKKKAKPKEIQEVFPFISSYHYFYNTKVKEQGGEQ